MGFENYQSALWAPSFSSDIIWVKLWASNILLSKWKQIEKIQKRLITSKFKIKSSVSYDIMLSETRATSIEAIAMVRLIRYLQRIDQMGEGRWSKVIFNEGMSERRNHG